MFSNGFCHQNRCLGPASEERPATWQLSMCVVEARIKKDVAAAWREDGLMRPVYQIYRVSGESQQHGGAGVGVKRGCTEVNKSWNLLYVDRIAFLRHTSLLKRDWFYWSDSCRRLFLPAPRPSRTSSIINAPAHIPKTQASALCLSLE